MQSADGPLVSIVTAAYNAAPYLEETIESVLTQGYPRLEYIVLDDGSTDETRAILERYTGRLIWDSHPNIGEARTVNKGFAICHGDPVAVVSADDPLLPGIVEAMVDWFASHPDVLVAYPDWEMIDENSEVIQHIRTFDYSYRDMVRWHHCLPGPGAFIRRSVIDAVGGRDPRFRYVGDYDFWLHAGVLGPFSRVARISRGASDASAGRRTAALTGSRVASRATPSPSCVASTGAKPFSMPPTSTSASTARADSRPPLRPSS